MVNMREVPGTGIPYLFYQYLLKRDAAIDVVFPRFVVHPFVAVAFFGWKDDGCTLVNKHSKGKWTP